MAIQIGTVDGLVNITEKTIKCFVNAIAAFSKDGLAFAKENSLSTGTGFQRFVVPVYKGESDHFDINTILKPVFTSSGKEQSPAIQTYCKKMGLLDCDDAGEHFNLTPLGDAIYSGEITVSEYAFILLSKQGCYKEKKCVVEALPLIAKSFKENPYTTEEVLRNTVFEELDDDEIIKTRTDIILNALQFAGLVTKLGKEGYYVPSCLNAAKVFDDIIKNETPGCVIPHDEDNDYTEYIGSLRHGVFDYLRDDNKSLYAPFLPNIVKGDFEAGLSAGASSTATKIKLAVGHNKIFFGTPGSGKSHRVHDIVRDNPDLTFRTTFHPDSDYASFVGSYKPTTEGKSITYEFVPQAFTNAYVTAWKNTEKPVFLVIEEINRGNCAQIFGDLFQLLDRDTKHTSEYPIKADSDLRNYLERPDVLGHGHEGIKNGELQLPGNLTILATMNTSDQSLFPMDSAFKRRWDWEFVPSDPECTDSKFTITIGDKTYGWPSFMAEANKRILKLSESEDKQMGNFFIKSNLNEEEFKSKVMFYLWSEVCKDYYKSGSFFKNANKGDDEFTFNELFPKNEETTAMLQGFMAYLNVETI